VQGQWGLSVSVSREVAIIFRLFFCVFAKAKQHFAEKKQRRTALLGAST